MSKNRVYIGQTKMKFIKRFWHHRWKLRNNQHDNAFLQGAWNKSIEDDFVFEIVAIIDKNENMNEIEMNYIAEFNSFNEGFNLTEGGDGKKSCPMSEDAKRIVGEKNRVHNLGKKRSLETRKRMSESSPHRKLTPENKKKLRESRIGCKHSDEAKLKMREKKLGSNSPQAKINESQAKEIKERIMSGEKFTKIAESMSIGSSIISSIAGERAWSHIYVDGWDMFSKEYRNKLKNKILSEQQVKEIRELISQNLKVSEIAKIFNIKENVVRGIKNNKTYKNIK